ncbi:MAG: hypothetical protein JW891_16975 [Candidatus Lokiarchaeota archaeon]|nr:hypothetical protein [Candidatus Lokiarchaeota archaeon]
MSRNDIILGLFYSDINNLIHEKIKNSEKLSQERYDQVKMLPFKFLGPVFLTSGSNSDLSWRIDFIESSLSLLQNQANNTGTLQTFFNINSTFKTEDSVTNLFTLIGSPYTEDIKVIEDKMRDYIHPIIEQGVYVNSKQLGRKFKADRYIREELERGIDLIEYYMGSSRKMYWEEQQVYDSVGIIERKSVDNSKSSRLYTFDLGDELKKKSLPLIPSYYVMTVLPDFYENLVNETLSLFDIMNYYTNIRQIKLSNIDKKVVYFEEYIEDRGNKRSLGVILVKTKKSSIDSKNLLNFRKYLRQYLDNSSTLEETIANINPRISTKGWSTNTDEELNDIHAKLDLDIN